MWKIGLYFITLVLASVTGQQICYCPSTEVQFDQCKCEPLFTSYGTTTHLPANWHLTNQYFDPDSVQLTFSFALKVEDEVQNKLFTELRSRSNPWNSLYGKWFTKDELANFVCNEDAVNAVINWVDHYNVEWVESYGDLVVVQASISTINQLFDTEIMQFVNTQNGQLHYSTWDTALHLPIWLNKYVEMVGGLYGVPFSSGSVGQVQQGQEYLTPYGLRQMYNVTAPMNWNESVSQAVAEFTGMSCVSNADLQQFLNVSGLDKYTLSESHILGDQSSCDLNGSYVGVESSLDIQYQMALQNNPNQYYLNVDEWLFEMTVELHRMEDPPKVISMSYGWSESDQCDPSVFGQCYWNAPPEEYTRRVNWEFGKLALRGVTLVASSGDSGSSGRSNTGCSLPEPFRPVFPTDSPFVTSVGGTVIMNPVIASPSENLPEVCHEEECVVGGAELNSAFDRCGWSSGGGFSNYFEMGWWQYNAIQEYLNGNTVKPNSSFFNPEGRAYPDVALISNNYYVVIDGVPQPVGGTSASSPAFSAMLTLLNNLRHSQGRSTLGLVGPLLYNSTECFQDITVGSTNSTEGGDCQYGYNAGVGFDPVYGLGLPNFECLYERVKNLPQ